MKARHHTGTYHIQSRRVTSAARADPHAICWRCGHTLAHHAPHEDGTPATWHAGHTIAGWIDAPAWLQVTQPPPPGLACLAAEASTCNMIAGGSGRPPQPHSRTWFT